ncbi:MAG: hypothetical protein JEZ02_16770 [Desulfatibacillum sp.]|nr:hypothetical protein [Desulfatibacillum sp.]
MKDSTGSAFGSPLLNLEKEIKTMRNHFSGTIWFALACGLLFVPATMALGIFAGPYWAFRLVLWGFLAGYALLLRRWANARTLSCLFPLTLLLALVFVGLPRVTFLVAALVILAWIRSGIYFSGPGARAWVMELGVSVGGAMLVNMLSPHSLLTWALAVWLFFLVQSLFFVLGPDNGATWEDPFKPEPFEQARQRAERILSGDG